MELVAVFVGNVLRDGAIDGLFRQTADDNQDVLHDVLLNKWGGQFKAIVRAIKYEMGNVRLRQ